MRPHHLNALFRFVFSSVTLWLVLSVGVLLFGFYSVPVSKTENQFYLVTKKIEELSPRHEPSEELKKALEDLRSASRDAEFKNAFFSIGMLFGVAALGVHLGSLWKHRANQRPEANAGKESVSPTTPGPGVAHP